MTALHQILNLARKAKVAHADALTAAYHSEQKVAGLSGMTRTYEPLAEGGTVYPDERVLVQTDLMELIADVTDAAVGAIDYTLTVDATNAVAKADVVIDGTVIAENIPAVALLALEKFLTDLRTFISKAPTLDPAYTWTLDPQAGLWRSETTTQVRMEKVPKVLVKYEATDKHAAQTEVYNADVPVGTWTITKFSGALSADQKSRYLANVNRLRDAVEVARGKANEQEVIDLKPGARILGYIFD